MVKDNAGWYFYHNQVGCERNTPVRLGKTESQWRVQLPDWLLLVQLIGLGVNVLLQNKMKNSDSSCAKSDIPSWL